MFVCVCAGVCVRVCVLYECNKYKTTQYWHPPPEVIASTSMQINTNLHIRMSMYATFMETPLRLLPYYSSFMALLGK